MSLSLSAALPWTDRAGRVSPLKAVVFVACLLPAAWIAFRWSAGDLGPQPLEAAIHEVGAWAVRLLVISLAVTPARRLLDWPKLIQVRRMLGLATLAYAGGHVLLYMADQDFALATIATEIALRVYLTIGFVAFLGLVALGATSTDGAIRRLGSRWTSLHRLVYPIAVLALVHHFLQAKADVFDASLMTGLFLLLMAYRGLAARRIPTGPVVLAATALAAGLATMAIEVTWYGLATGVQWQRILWANLDPTVMIRPAWWVAAVGLAVAVAAFLRRRPEEDTRGRRVRAAG